MNKEKPFTISSLMLYLIERCPSLIENLNHLELLAIYIYFSLEENKEVDSMMLEDSFQVSWGKILASSAHEKTASYKFQKISKQYRKGKYPYNQGIYNNHFPVNSEELSYQENTSWDNPVFRYYQVGELLKIDKMVKEYLMESDQGMITDEVLVKRIISVFDSEQKDMLKRMIERSKNATWVMDLPLNGVENKNSKFM